MIKRIALTLSMGIFLVGCSSDKGAGKDYEEIFNKNSEDAEAVTEITSQPVTTEIPIETVALTMLPETEPPTEEPADGELVLIKDFIPDIVLDIRYATKNNFTGTVIYENSDAFLCYGTVKKLAKVQDELKKHGYSIVVWDPYRPVEAQERLWEVCPDPVYVADPRNGITSHSKGNTIDLGIVNLDGSEVELPSGFDDFSLIADRDYSDVSEKAAENSQLLEDIMTKNGFYGYWGEWWHYSDNESYEVIYN